MRGVTMTAVVVMMGDDDHEGGKGRGMSTRINDQLTCRLLPAALPVRGQNMARWLCSSACDDIRRCYFNCKLLPTVRPGVDSDIQAHDRVFGEVAACE
jgi:hypothetical protein